MGEPAYKSQTILFFLALYALGFCNLGPFPLYVNKETGQVSTFQGTKSYTSDCCESGTANIITNGPIVVQVTPALSMGPDETKVWNGEIKPDINGAPPAGSSVNASFTVDYTFNYWKSDGTPLPSKQGSETVDFIIYSLKVDVPEEKLLGSGCTTQMTATEYPAGGTFHWSTPSNKIKLTDTDRKTVTIEALGNNIGEATVKCKYTISGVSFEKKAKIIIFNLRVRLSKPLACDGELVGIILEPLPTNLDKRKVASCLKNLKVLATPATPSQGNPIGHANLTIDPVDLSAFKTRIQRAIWYSTTGSGCNVISGYKIKAIAESSCGNGNLESSEVLLRVSTSFQDCVNGSAIPGPPYFTGLPDIRITYQVGIISPSGYVVRIFPGTFRKNVHVAVTIAVNADSQYRGMVEKEENFHARQFRGTTAIPQIRGMWNAQSVIQGADNLIRGIVFASNNSAWRNAVAAFRIALGRELARTTAIWNWNLRCALEKEAKNAIHATFRATMPCAYPACP